MPGAMLGRYMAKRKKLFPRSTSFSITASTKGTQYPMIRDQNT